MIVSKVFFFFFMSLLIVRNNHILARIYNIFLKKPHTSILNLDPSEKIGKVVIKQDKCQRFFANQLLEFQVQTVPKALELQKLSNKSNLKRSGGSQKQVTVSRDNHLQNIPNKLQFSCEIVHFQKNPISLFNETFTITDKIFISGVGLNTRQ